MLMYDSPYSYVGGSHIWSLLGHADIMVNMAADRAMIV